MSQNSRFSIYVLVIFAVFTAAIAIAGYFKIGLLSDDYLNINGSIHSGIIDKLTGNLQLTNSYHLRTTYYLSMQSSSYLHDKLGFAYDDFILYRIQNLLLYFTLAFIAGRILLLATNHLSVSVLTSLAIIIYPNNANNLCWTAGRVDLLCGIFYLFALYFAFKYIKENEQTTFIYCIISFIAALLTKETSLSIPIITAILIYAFYGKELLLRNKLLIIAQLVLIGLYVFYKLAILGNDLGQMITLYQSSPFANAPGILARAAIALTIPLDYLTLNISLKDKDFFLMVYLGSLYGAVFYITSVMIRNEIYKYIYYIIICAAILLIPNIYIGYIRTQMIIIPFVILSIIFFWSYDHQLKDSIHINKILLKIFFLIALSYWSITCIGNINDWSLSYTLAKNEIGELLKTDIESNKNTVIIGNPGRYRQAFMFDKLTGAYNYWKNKEFVIKDTINDIVQTGSLDEESITAKLDYKQISPVEYEISATGKSQFFYMEGFDNERIKQGFKNQDMSVDFKNFNQLNKPKTVNLKILNPNVSCFIASGMKFIKIY